MPESRPDLVEGIRELIIRQTEPVLRSSLIEGEMEVIIMRLEVWTEESYRYMLISSTCPI